MLLQRFDRWRRRLDLDRLRCQSERTGEQSVIELTADDGDSIRPINRLIAAILLQAAHDRVLAIHLFRNDEEQLEMLYCLAVPPELQATNAATNRTAAMIEPDWPRPPDSRWPRTWFEMVAPPPDTAARLFERLRWYAGLSPGLNAGTLWLRREGRDLAAAVAAPQPDDIRIFFGPERPPIRPKIARQIAGPGMPLE